MEGMIMKWETYLDMPVEINITKSIPAHIDEEGTLAGIKPSLGLGL